MRCKHWISIISANFFRNAFVKNFQEITCTNCLEHSLFLYIVPNFIAFFSSKSLSHINSEIGRFFKTKARHVLNIFLPSLYALHLFNVTKMLAASDFWTGFYNCSSISLDLACIFDFSCFAIASILLGLQPLINLDIGSLQVLWQCLLHHMNPYPLQYCAATIYSPSDKLSA